MDEKSDQPQNDAPKGYTDPLVLAQIERYRKEGRKFDEEARYLRLQRTDFKHRVLTPWYKKERFLQVVVAGVLGIPVLLGLHDRILKPFYEMENIKLSLENQKQARELNRRGVSVDSMEEVIDSANKRLTQAWEMVNEREDMLDSVRLVLAGLSSTTANWPDSRTPSNVQEIQRRVLQRLQSVPTRSEAVPYRPGQFAITNHRLTGPNVTVSASPNIGAAFTEGMPDALLFHFTAGRNLEESIRAFAQPDLKIGTHLLIGRDGRVVQLTPFNVSVFHAGQSSYGGRSGYNKYSIAIDFDNAGRLTKRGNDFVAWFGQAYPQSEVVTATHRHETTPAYWHRYTPVQIEVAKEVGALLVKEYGIREILGHEDVSRGRKFDPGPAFPLADVRRRVLGDG